MASVRSTSLHMPDRGSRNGFWNALNSIISQLSCVAEPTLACLSDLLEPHQEHTSALVSKALHSRYSWQTQGLEVYVSQTSRSFY